MSTIPYDQMGVPQKSTASNETSYSPTSQEEELIKKLDSMFQKAKKKREKYDEKWADYYRYFRGRQWKNKRPSYRHSEVVNLIFQVIQSQVPLLSDARPRFEYLPEDPSDREFAEIMNEVSEYDWVQNNWLNILVEVLYEAKIFGTGLSTLYFDPEKNDGMGGQCYESVDPFTFFPNSEARDIDRECFYLVIAEPKSLDWIKIHYKEKGKYVKGDVIDFEYLERSEVGESTSNGRNTDQEYTGNKGSDLEERAVLFTYLFLDKETYEAVTKDIQEGNGLQAEEKILKYPNGRKVVRAGNVILEDKQNPYDFFNYQKLQNYILPREFWGMSEIEQIEGPQNIFNKIYSFVLDVLTLMGNPVWVIDSESKVNQDGLINRPGLVVTKKQGTEVRREAGVQLQPYVTNIMQSVQQYVGDVSGSQDVSRGVAPAGITATSALEKLDESARSRIRLNSKLIDNYLQTMGKQYLANVLEFYTVPLVYRITGKDGVEKYFKFYIDNREFTNKSGQKSTQKFAIVRPFMKGDDGVFRIGDQKEHEIKGKFDVRVITGTSLPFAQAERETKTLNYFKAGLIDQEETLKRLDYPNYQEIIQRMQEAAMQAQQAPIPS